MKKEHLLYLLIAVLSFSQLGMGKREGQYDEEARAAERQGRLHKNELQETKEEEAVDETVEIVEEKAGNYEVEEPEQGTDEPTKIKIKIPGT